ncbi:MAG: histidine kinase, partial [Nitriliruptorales bacterium]|nr:histidine kinase [Nitriliruptorales bacterium]
HDWIGDREAELLEQVPTPLQRFTAGETRCDPEQHEMLIRGQQVDDAGLLGAIADTTRPEDLARIGLEQPSTHAQHGRLADPVLTDQRDDLTPVRGLRVDLVLRRSLVYGVLWTLIAVGYVALTAVLGLIAVDQLPVVAAIVATILATLVFQPLRRSLENLADRWVFGERLGRYEAMRRLGRSLEGGPNLPDLLPQLAATIRDGLGLEQVRVVVETTNEETGATIEFDGCAGTAEAAPDLTVPVVQAGETLGRIECILRRDDELDDVDRELLADLARQSGLAIRNLRLTHALEDTITSLRERSSELRRSRTRLVRAQEEERRRIERDLHDGAQQHIVALIAQIGLARRHAARNSAAAEEALRSVQVELGQVLDELRDLARGVHPSLLAAGGLLPAVEAQTARSPVPVTVHADEDVRLQRFSPEVESAAYFTVTESLANLLKHANASSAQVRLRRRNGRLRIAIHDDGCGFDPHATHGDGLRNLAGRVEAVGGTLSVDSKPGAGTTVRADLVIDRNGDG